MIFVREAGVKETNFNFGKNRDLNAVQESQNVRRALLPSHDRSRVDQLLAQRESVVLIARSSLKTNMFQKKISTKKPALCGDPASP